MGKYDAYASKPDKDIMKQNLKNDALKCAMGLARNVVVAPEEN